MTSISPTTSRKLALHVHVTSARLHRWATWISVALVFLLILGSSWDGDWHGRVGRDSFWIPPHLMIYSSVTFFGLVALGITVWTSLRESALSRGMLRLFGIQAPTGIALMGIGVLLTFSAAPFDDWWHRSFGIDISIWSPPHFIGWAGFLVSLIGVQFAIAREWPRLADGKRSVSWPHRIAFALAAGGMLRHLTLATLPGVSYSIWDNARQLQEVPIFHPFLLALSASVFMVPALLMLYRIGGRRGLVIALSGLMLLAVVANAFVGTFTPLLLEALGETWRTFAGDTTIQDLFLIPVLFTILPTLSVLVFRTVHALQIGALLGFVYWAQLAIILASLGRIESGTAIGGLLLCIGIGAVTGWLGGKLGTLITQAHST